MVITQVTHEQLQRWGVDEKERKIARKLYPDGIPFTPEAFVRLQKKGFCPLRPLVRLLSGKERASLVTHTLMAYGGELAPGDELAGMVFGDAYHLPRNADDALADAATEAALKLTGKFILDYASSAAATRYPVTSGRYAHTAGTLVGAIRNEQIRWCLDRLREEPL